MFYKAAADTHSTENTKVQKRFKFDKNLAIIYAKLKNLEQQLEEIEVRQTVLKNLRK